MGLRSSSPNISDRFENVPGVRVSWTTLRYSMITAVIPAAAVAALALWAMSSPPITLPTSPRGAMAILTLITVGVAYVMRALRHRFDFSTLARLSVPDPLYTLYLAALILVGLPNGVLLAVVTPLAECVPDLWREPGTLRRALPQSAAAGVTLFCSGFVYYWLSGVLTPPLSALRAHILGAVVASLLTCFGAATVQIFSTQSSGMSHECPGLPAIRRYVASPALRFQILLLSVGPLLPLAELLDGIDAEFAWLLFLVPLCAVYYLALTSVRLEQRTQQLQKTVVELQVARRREAELSGYAALITRAQEDERRRLARELHDDTAQALIALSRGLDSLVSRRVEPPLSSNDIRFGKELGDLAKRTLESVRRACQDLRPSVLDDLGLSAALESLAQSESKRGLECSFQQHGESRSCAPEIEVTIYRIAQESLSNARRHAQATETKLELHYEPSAIRLKVRDNGKGFDWRHTLDGTNRHATTVGTEQRSGLGLLGMRERAALIGAHLTISSSRNDGTTVILSVPT